ncbi:hypothetical protein DSTSK_35950 [Desulforhabdus sp. TSK]|nr:hypothetical protein [Desulforhabdus sp. TSK]GKT10290.1 hypothetical protein DSTSK_35950 [Desulforhabdus sp. TSK]
MLNTCGRPVRLNVLLGKYVTKKLWRKVSPVLPGKGMVADNELTKVVLFFERLKDRTVQFVREIDLSTGSIIESEPYSVASKVSGFFDMKDHGITPMEILG